MLIVKYITFGRIDFRVIDSMLESKFEARFDSLYLIKLSGI